MLTVMLTVVLFIPITKYICLVLCLNAYMPSQVPRLPPIKLMRNRVLSFILPILSSLFFRFFKALTIFLYLKTEPIVMDIIVSSTE